MKKLLLSAISTLMLISCSSDDDSSGSNLSSSPEAKIEYNDNNFGIYKGIFVGSSGIVKVNIHNDGTVGATLVIDGTTRQFSTTENVAENEDTYGLTFINGSDSFDFNVSANGQAPYISDLVISGHPDANIEILKEYSDAQVKCYQGSFGGDDSGVFNLVTIEDAIYGLAKPAGNPDSLWLQGYLDESGNITGIFDNGTFTGELNGNSMSGTWENALSESGNWSGTRKL